MSAPVRSTAIATVEPPAPSYALTSPVGKILSSEQAKAVIMPLLPHGVEFERVIVEVHRAAATNADILKCSPESIILAVGKAVQTGLEIGRTIHLVPISGKLQAWNDYKGDIELVIRSGAARAIDGQAVYENDTFEYELGDAPWLKHRPAKLGQSRGRMIGAYSVAFINITGTLKKIAVMSMQEIEAIRSKSRAWSPKTVAECPEWYAIKTAIHRNCKALPKSEALARVLAMFDQQDDADHGEDLNPANEVQPTSKVDGLPAGFAFAPNEDAGPESPSKPGPMLSEAARYPMPFGSSERKGKPLSEFTNEELALARLHAQKKGGHDEFLTMSERFIAEREHAIKSDQVLKDDDDDLPF